MSEEASVQTAMTHELAVLCDWIRAKRSNAAAIDLDTDLIENRLIDSMEFAEFLFTLEEVSGNVIDLADVELDSFRTLRSIHSKFLKRKG